MAKSDFRLVHELFLLADNSDGSCGRLLQPSVPTCRVFMVGRVQTLEPLRGRRRLMFNSRMLLPTYFDEGLPIGVTMILALKIGTKISLGD